MLVVGKVLAVKECDVVPSDPGLIKAATRDGIQIELSRLPRGRGIEKANITLS